MNDMTQVRFTVTGRMIGNTSSRLYPIMKTTNRRKHSQGPLPKFTSNMYQHALLRHRDQTGRAFFLSRVGMPEKNKDYNKYKAMYEVLASYGFQNMMSFWGKRRVIG